jgi:hypothetical protein
MTQQRAQANARAQTQPSSSAMLAGMQSLLQASQPGEAPQQQQQQQQAQQQQAQQQQDTDIFPRLIDQLRCALAAGRAAGDPEPSKAAPACSSRAAAPQLQQQQWPAQAGGGLLGLLKGCSPPARGPVSAALALARAQAECAIEGGQPPCAASLLLQSRPLPASQQQPASSTQQRLQPRPLLPAPPAGPAALLPQPLPKRITSTGLLAPFLSPGKGPAPPSGQMAHGPLGAGVDNSDTHSWQPPARAAGVKTDAEDIPAAARLGSGDTKSHVPRREAQALEAKLGATALCGDNSMASGLPAEPELSPRPAKRIRMHKGSPEARPSPGAARSGIAFLCQNKACCMGTECMLLRG